MISLDGSTEAQISDIRNCTTASSFEKPNSLKFELLFGDYCEKRAVSQDDKDIVEAHDYLFLPGQIFGFAYESAGTDFKKFHHAFVVRSSLPGETGNVVPGIFPGAEILVKTMSSAATERLKSILQTLSNNSVILTALSVSQYGYLNHLLEIKFNTDFFVGELIELQRHD